MSLFPSHNQVLEGCALHIERAVALRLAQALDVGGEGRSIGPCAAVEATLPPMPSVEALDFEPSAFPWLPWTPWGLKKWLELGGRQDGEEHSARYDEKALAIGETNGGVAMPVGAGLGAAAALVVVVWRRRFVARGRRSHRVQIRCGGSAGK